MGMSKYDRLLYILNLLRARKNLNARLLATECGVTERSIYRDILALSEANIPIYYDNGYKLASDSFLPPLNFDVEEYSCLKLALDSTPLTKIAKYNRLIKEIQAKIDSRLSESVRQQERFTPATTTVEIDASVTESRGEKYYQTIERAINEQSCLEIEYDSITSGVTKRVVEPYFLIFISRSFYFVAYCRLRKDFRTFRVDRLLSVEPLTEAFTRKKGVEADTYFEDSWKLFHGAPVSIVVRFTGTAARVVKLTRHHPKESIEDISDSEIMYRVTTRGHEEVQRWILGFGAEAKVLEPQEMREAIAETARALIAQYDISGK